jgi:hypothetical protein
MSRFFPPDGAEARPVGGGRGWIAPWLDRMNRHFDDQGFNDSGPQDTTERTSPAQPSDVVRASRRNPAVLADFIGPSPII